MNPKAFKLKGKGSFLLMVLIIAAIGGSAVFLMYRGPDADRKMPSMRSSAHRMQIEGLRFYGMHQGRKVISITADRFTIQRGRFGFFRTGLTQEAKIENARIDLYAAAVPPQKDRGEPPSTGPHGRTPAVSAPDDAVPAGTSPHAYQTAGRSAAPLWNFGDLFAGEALASLLPTKSITAIEAAPVTITLFGGSSVLTRVTASSAAIRLRDQDILFTGGVRVSSGEVELTTERLFFIPRTARLKVDDAFILKGGFRTLQGSSLTTDLFLRPL